MTKHKTRVDSLTIVLLLLALLYSGMYVFEQWQAKARFPEPTQVEGCASFIAGQTKTFVLVCDAMPQRPPDLSSEVYVRIAGAMEQTKCPPNAAAWTECQTMLIRSE